MSVIKWLEKWYYSNCDGDWEHSYENIRIKTLDNPGWAVDINLIDTPFEEKPFSKLQIDRSGIDWIYCSVTEGVFKGRGGSENLEEILTVFKNWATEDNAQSI